MPAQMMDWDRGHHDGFGWGWVLMVIMLLVLVALTVLVVRHFADTRRGSRRAADDVLAERFARGEIDEEEFRRRRAALRD